MELNPKFSVEVVQEGPSHTVSRRCSDDRPSMMVGRSVKYFKVQPVETASVAVLTQRGFLVLGACCV